MAQLKIPINSTHSFSCGGSIISVNSILTAAHCTFGIPTSEITARVGTKYNGRGGKITRVVKVIIHPLYDATNLDYDIAILQLKTSIELVPKIKELVKLPAQDENIADGTVVLVTGWGDTTNKLESQDLLRGVEIPIVNQEVCKTAYPDLIAENLCAGYYEKGGKDACQGEINVF